GPSHAGFGGVPGVVDGAEGEAMFRIEVVIQADQVFAPMRRLSDGSGEDRVRARTKIRLWNHRQQGLHVGIVRIENPLRKQVQIWSVGSAIDHHTSIWVSGDKRAVRNGVAELRSGRERDIANISEVAQAIGIRRNEVIEVLRNLLSAPVLQPEE